MRSLQPFHKAYLRPVFGTCIRCLPLARRRFVALLLIAMLASISLPPAVAGALTREAVTRSSGSADRLRMALSGWFKGKGSAQGPGSNRGSSLALRNRRLTAKAERQNWKSILAARLSCSRANQ
jgi:hypothetical protein